MALDKITKKVNPLVTIAIPTYNRADSYLKQAIEIAFNQTYQDIEIIISDNCSSDDTETLVKTFTDPRIRYFRQKENIGANNNFNFCLEQAKGDYFLLFHDDDLIDNDFIETCMEAANYSPDIGLIRTGVRIIDVNGNILREKQNIGKGLSINDFFMAFLTGKISMFLCGTLFNTRCLREIGGFGTPQNLWQDVYAEFRILAKYGRVDVKEIKASFRKHDLQRTSNVDIQGWCKDSLFLLDLMCNLASEKEDCIRTRGMYYFTRQNYIIASNIKSLSSRFISYLAVYKTFDYSYSPLNFIYSKTILSRRNKMKQAIKNRVKYIWNSMDVFK
ncbi:GalNAc(5)-diNAcBac-PP-undecaprenol beta-1,3-glucosyltransferase [bacterium BMS3Abin07]|nr:GalNAc(5)-diNAcBac-PP-undecaprenol beta-1,3-glucosyltransferase [bacterium BMS3Abin07]